MSAIGGKADMAVMYAFDPTETLLVRQSFTLIIGLPMS
jgi:hypothetical protein